MSWNKKSKKNNTKTKFELSNRRKKDKHDIQEDRKIRLNKFISNSGICSRREADKFIEAGVVSVNGIGITEMGFRVSPLDIVKFNGEKLKTETLQYILLNKPKNYSGRIEDAPRINSAMQLIKKACKEKIYPIDKLNKKEMGLLLFTNDLDLAKKIGSNNQKIKTIYQITLDKNLTYSDLEKIRKGVTFNGKKLSLDAISYLKGKDKNELGIENSIGGLKRVKKLFQNFGYTIVMLDRVFLGGLTKKDLPRKHYRHLSDQEINILKRL